MDILELIIQHIIESGICSQKDKDIFKQYTPDNKTTAVSVYEIQGSSYHHYTGMNTRRVQVVVRDLSLRAAQNKCWEIFRLFDSEEQVIEIGGIKFPYRIKTIPLKRYIDDKDRHHVQFDVNFLLNNRL